MAVPFGSMAPCLMKESVEKMLRQARAALATAEGEQVDALRELVTQCNAALAKVKRANGYPGGRLDTTAHATAAFNALKQVSMRFPDLLGD